MPAILNRIAAFVVLAVLASAVQVRPAEAFICFSFSFGGGPTISYGTPHGIDGPWYGPVIGPPVPSPFRPVSPMMLPPPGLYRGPPLYHPIFPATPFFGQRYGWR